MNTEAKNVNFQQNVTRKRERYCGAGANGTTDTVDVFVKPNMVLRKSKGDRRQRLKLHCG